VEIGIAYDLRSDFVQTQGGPEDALEEYDSPETVEAIERTLQGAGYTTRRLGGGRAFLAAALEAPGDLVFNIAEGRGTRSREAHVPAVLEMLGVPCTHSDPLTLAACLDKAVAKRLVAASGVPTPRFAVVEREEDLARIDLPFPMFAKPLYEGSSMGIRRRSRLADPRELRERSLELLEAYREPVLVEEFCPGAEFTVGILGTGANARAIGVMEVRPRLVPESEFVYSLEVKRNERWQEELEYSVPPKRPEALVREVERVALAAFRALGCRDVARVDLRLAADGAPRFLEANPLPGLKPGWGDLPILADLAGMPYARLITSIVESARGRYGMERDR
jgi:D-alanine-D-alanine ligase